MADQTKLIQLSDFTPYRAITANLNVAKHLEPYILEAQEFELKNLLGREMYIDLLDDFISSPSLAKYADVYNGKEYTYNGFLYRHQGLVPVLCYLTYARYLMNANVHSTAYGIVEKNTAESKAIEEKTRARIITQARSVALAYWEDVKVYLSHATTYTLYNCGTEREFNGLPRIKAVGRSYTDNN